MITIRGLRTIRSNKLHDILYSLYAERKRVCLNLSLSARSGPFELPQATRPYPVLFPQKCTILTNCGAFQTVKDNFESRAYQTITPPIWAKVKMNWSHFEGTSIAYNRRVPWCCVSVQWFSVLGLRLVCRHIWFCGGDVQAALNYFTMMEQSKSSASMLNRTVWGATFSHNRISTSSTAMFPIDRVSNIAKSAVENESK